MRKIYAFCCLIVTLCSLQGQNLVPNPSFEDTLSCPDDQDELYKAPPWFRPTFNTPDLFNKCYHSSSPTPVGVPNNFEGHQYARTGNGYAGFAIIFNKSYPTDIGAEYIEVRLIDSLKAGKNYTITFYVSLGDTSAWATNRVGAFISKDSIFNYSTTVELPYSPQIENPIDSELTNKIDWVPISGTYKATGGEKFITIGDFYNYPGNAFDSLPTGVNYTYYYIDDVSVTLDSGEGIQNFSNSLVFSVFPNPASTNLTIQTSLSEHPVSITMLNLLGQNISQTQPPVQSFYSVDVGDLAKGVYIVQVQDLRNGAVGRQKIVVQ